MKKAICILSLLFFCLSAKAQHSYISSDSLIVLEANAIAIYDTPDIYVDATYYTLQEVWVASIRVIPAGATTDFKGRIDVEFAQADVDALTGSGATETRTIQNTILQAVKAYLEDINPGVTFTLH